MDAVEGLVYGLGNSWYLYSFAWLRMALGFSVFFKFFFLFLVSFRFAVLSPSHVSSMLQCKRRREVTYLDNDLRLSRGTARKRSGCRRLWSKIIRKSWRDPVGHLWICGCLRLSSHIKLIPSEELCRFLFWASWILSRWCNFWQAIVAISLSWRRSAPKWVLRCAVRERTTEP